MYRSFIIRSLWEMETKTIILNHQQILQKVKRISYEILEHNLHNNTIWLGGLNERGYYLAQLIQENLKGICSNLTHLFQIQFLDIEQGSYKASIENMPEPKEGDTIILIDDVLNSGKTLANAMVPFIQMNPSKLNVVVLADRNHRRFPVYADYVGISLATTLQEHVYFDASNQDDLLVYLK